MDTWELDAWIEAQRMRLAALAPLARKSLDALARWQDVELTYGSNAIEGNTLTRSETATVLEKGLTIGGKPLRDHLEALDHRDALGFIRSLARDLAPIREADVRAIHQLVLGRSQPGEAGAYSTARRFISGSCARLPPPAELPALMAELRRRLQDTPASPETAFEAHWRLAMVLPFTDGNGRTARLPMNLLLLRVDCPPVVIGPEEHTAYLDAIETRNEGDRAPYDVFMRVRLLASLNQAVEAASNEAEAGP